MDSVPPDNARQPDRGELASWLSRLVDGQLTAEEAARLELQFLHDPAALAEYCDFMDTEFMLAWELKCRGVSDAPTAPPPPSAARLWQRVAMWLMPLVLFGSGCLTLWASITWTLETSVFVAPANVLTAQALAVLSRAEAAVWKSGSDVVAGHPLPPGPLALAEGTAQITFASGAVVAMHAPTEVEVLGPNRLLLRRGRITPFVPDAAKGFTVVSPAGEVVDLGTEFSMSVGDNGKTDVFVINGEVDIGRGQLASVAPLRLTQGFASTLSADAARPHMTQRPMLVERFDNPSPLFRRVIVRDDADQPPAAEATLWADGELRIPIEGRLDGADPTVQVMLDRELSDIVGKRSTISYKISLPPAAALTSDRWAGLAIDPGDGPLPWAHQKGASAGILVSPSWQVGLHLNGRKSRSGMSIWPRETIFPRGSEAVGPYQVVITLDDSPAVRDRLGGTAFGFMVNGVEFMRDQPITLGAHPRIAFQTFFPRGLSGRGFAAIDDFSISVEGLPETGAF